MIPPGLLPDSPEPRRSAAPWVLGAVVFVALLAIAAALAQIRVLTRERDEAVRALVAAKSRPVEPPARSVEEPRPAPAPSPPPAAPSEAPPPAPSRAPDIRVVPVRPSDPQNVAQGLHEFRAARYDSAERLFYRAFPDSMLYLALTSLAQARYAEAIGFLHRAMTIDPEWLQKVRPGDLFGTKAAYTKVLRALEEQLEKDPINADLKTLLAYLRYHDKGAPYAKALLIEATNAQPDHDPARVFLEAIGP